MRNLILGLVIGGYIGAGLFGALLMKQGIPALNGLGMAYIAVTWPKTIYCARTVNNCDPTGGDTLNQYFFTTEN